jgi:hypothetical protein
MAASIKVKQSEDDFGDQVIKLAQLCGWLVAHFRPAKTNKGWRTPVSADGAGFPDLVLVHAGHGLIIFAELKSMTGEVSDEQLAWLIDLDRISHGSSNLGVYVWTPADWPEIERTLKGEKPLIRKAA